MSRFPSSVRGPWTWTVLLALGLLGACVCPPSAEELLAVGFRSPDQAFRTFQTATRLDDPDLELRCFSTGFRSRNGISQLTWREARAELYARQPWLRAGIVGADVVERQIGTRQARLRIDTAGGDYVVELVLEDFAEIWAGETRVLDDEIKSWRDSVLSQQNSEETTWIVGRVQSPMGLDTRTITDLRFGREWKIDAVGPLDDTDESSPPRAQSEAQPQAQ